MSQSRSFSSEDCFSDASCPGLVSPHTSDEELDLEPLSTQFGRTTLTVQSAMASSQAPLPVEVGTWLDVPFHQKHVAKQLGAKWSLVNSK